MCAYVHVCARACVCVCAPNLKQPTQGVNTFSVKLQSISSWLLV